MRLGLEVMSNVGKVWIAYNQVGAIRLVKNGQYEIFMKSGHRIAFKGYETFQRLRNYVVTGHPVLDEVGPPNGGKGVSA